MDINGNYYPLGDPDTATFKSDDQGIYIEYTSTGDDETERL